MAKKKAAARTTGMVANMKALVKHFADTQLGIGQFVNNNLKCLLNLVGYNTTGPKVEGFTACMRLGNVCVHMPTLQHPLKFLIVPMLTIIRNCLMTM